MPSEKSSKSSKSRRSKQRGGSDTANSSSTQLSMHTNFKKIGKEYKLAKSKFKEEEEKARKLVEEESKTEKEELDKAYEKYTKKIDSILGSDVYKEMEQKATTYSKVMTYNLTKASKEFARIHKEIMNKKGWDSKKKQDKIKTTYEYILDKLYSKEEVDQFKKMMTAIVMVVPATHSTKKEKVEIEI